MGNETNKEVVRRLIDEVANGRNTSAVNDVLTEDFRLPPGPDGLDRASFVAVLEYYSSPTCATRSRTLWRRVTRSWHGWR